MRYLACRIVNFVQHRSASRRSQPPSILWPATASHAQSASIPTSRHGQREVASFVHSVLHWKRAVGLDRAGSAVLE